MEPGFLNLLTSFGYQNKKKNACLVLKKVLGNFDFVYYTCNEGTVILSPLFFLKIYLILKNDSKNFENLNFVASFAHIFSPFKFS